MDKTIFRAQESYPQVQPCPLNQHDLQIICPLYSGTLSELTAILQYSYQHLIIHEQCAEVAETIMGIAMVEMHHLDMLGCAIVALGGNPKYVNPNTRNWWNSSVVCYDKDLCDALLVDLKQETEAHQAYLTAATKVSNQTLAALLRCIAADEKVHMELFTCMINCHRRKNECKAEPRNECRAEPRNDCRPEPRNDCRRN